MPVCSLSLFWGAVGIDLPGVCLVCNSVVLLFWFGGGIWSGLKGLLELGLKALHALCFISLLRAPPLLAGGGACTSYNATETAARRLPLANKLASQRAGAWLAGPEAEERREARPCCCCGLCKL